MKLDLYDPLVYFSLEQGPAIRAVFRVNYEARLQSTARWEIWHELIKKRNKETQTMMN